jgi:hypothetical protein
MGAGSAVALGLAGGIAIWITPGLDAEGGLTGAGLNVFHAVGRAVLDGTLPVDTKARELALQGMQERIDGLTRNLPVHAQEELSQLLALLGTSAGRYTLTGLNAHWSEATVEQIQHALQAMRTSGLAVKQQVYHALHDIVAGAYFADATTWSRLGYPGPLKI